MGSSTKVRNITELAQIAGVSAGTVSRALANSPLIAQKTRDRIQALARLHDFRPNVMARNLRTRRTHAIGVVIPATIQDTDSATGLFVMTMLGHLADALAERAHDLLLSRASASDPDFLTQLIDSGRVDGVIIMDPTGSSDRAMATIANHAVPLVAWGAPSADQTYCSVSPDCRGGGALAVQHLLDRGARRIALLGDSGPPHCAIRLMGMQQAMRTAGQDDSLALMFDGRLPEQAYARITQWLDGKGQAADGIVAASDQIAAVVLRALAERGRSVPSDVRVIGFEDLPATGQTVPSFTSIHHDLAAGAAQMVDLLFLRMSGGAAASVVLEPQLVVRASS